MKKLSVLLVFALLLVSVTAAFAETPPAPSYEEVWDGRGTDSLACEKAGEFGRPASGWIHWVFSTKGDSTDALLTLGGTGSGTYSPGEPLNAEIWHFYTPFFELDGLTASIQLFGGEPGPGGGLVISDYCPGEKEMLEVTKTAKTSFTRTHDWKLAKEQKPGEIFLYTDGSGDAIASWNVAVQYRGFVDSNFKVSGQVIVKNTGNIPAVITSIEDILAGEVIALDCGVTFPYTLAVGATLTCSYSVDGKLDGVNKATVTTEKDTYMAEAPIVWGGPTTEINKTVTVTDHSNIFGHQELGTLDAANLMVGQITDFKYQKSFAWEDYGRENCGYYEYNNTAKLINEKGVTIKEDSTTLKVYVQCFIFKGETAWAANGNAAGSLHYTDRGNWATYVAFAEKTTTLFAGQTIPVGQVTFAGLGDGSVRITVGLFANWEFEDVSENLMVQGYATAPSGNPSPGLFADKKGCDSSAATCSIDVPANNFFGVHVNVGTWMPDPNFGPSASVASMQ